MSALVRTPVTVNRRGSGAAAATAAPADRGSSFQDRLPREEPERQPSTGRAGGDGRKALALGAAAFLAVAATVGDLGVTWDEPGYLTAAKLETAWLGALPAKLVGGSLASWVSSDTLETYWHHDPYHNPHPPLYKILSGLTWRAFHPFLGDYAAFRLATAALFGGLMGLLFLWGTRAGRARSVGVGAALAFLLMPRVFGDAHIAATDMPLTVFWGAAAYFFWRAAGSGARSSILTFGAFWGMALATKFNGLLLPVPLALWALIHSRRHLLRTLVLGGATATGVMVLLNPYLWPDPLGRLLDFIGQSTSREVWAPIRTYYLGRSYAFVLPWHHALVMTAATVPLPLLVLGGVGGIRPPERAGRSLGSFCLIQIGFQQLLMALPSSPGHDGVRLFLPQFPFLALLAGLGFARLRDRVTRHTRSGRPWLTPAARAALAALFFLPPAAALVRSHPYELAYFNEVVGGARGAYARGFETTYWFDAATPAFLERLESELPLGARVRAWPAPWHFRYLQEGGLLRGDIVFTDSLPASYLLLLTRQGAFGAFEWRLHRHVAPLAVESYDGVPLLALYRGWE